MNKFKEWLKPIMTRWLGLGDEAAQAEIKQLQSRLDLANDAAASMGAENDRLKADWAAMRRDLAALDEKAGE